MKILFIFCCFLLLFAGCKNSELAVSEFKKEKTAFQTGSQWIPEIDVRSDIAIVYGANDRHGLTFEERVKSWRDRNYETHFMTGIAWGDYKDYYLGKWDGQNHMDVSQVEQNGKQILHGENNPYVVPVKSFVEYIKSEVITKVIDAGISSIYLEEPEFWARAGYSELFKKEWQNYYGFPWKPQHESPENTYLSNKLKYQLYFNAIKEVSSFAKEYGKSKGIDIKVYIPTHSLVNYSSWQIVSPEASLASLPGIDGYIAQVWTGTSREPTYFKGLKKERVFENAFLEYGSMVSMTAPTNRKIFFLTDPIEDWPRDWQDYKQNYEATFTAQLLYPMVADYEVMPWPERIYTRPYKVAGSNEEVLIPRYYSTQMQVMINALNDMPNSENKVSGSHGIGILMSNSLMFQRFPVHDGYDDPQFSNFYGQTLPLLKRGIPIETVHMENLEYENTLKDIRVLIMSYSNMKPLTAESHKYLSTWVKNGGVLIYCGKDDDPYQTVMEWWNTNGNSFEAPSEHLFSLLHITSPLKNEKFNVEKGVVYVVKQNPKEFVLQENADQHYVDLVKDAWDNATKSEKLQFDNYLFLQRGPYDIVSVMDESVSNEAFSVNGTLIDLYDPKLPVLSEKTVQPGTQALLYNIDRIVNKKQPQVLATAARITDEKLNKKSYSFVAKSPVNTTNSMRILLPQNPKQILVKTIKGVELTEVDSSWDENSKTLYLGFENSPDGIEINLNW